jgi:hypothetical protein
MATVIADLGNGSGFVYVTGPGGAAELITSFNNDTQGREHAFALGALRANPDSATTLYDTVLAFSGNRFFLDQDPAAVQGLIGGAAIEITRYLIGRTSQAPNYVTSATIAGGVIEFDRVSNITYIDVETQGGAGTDDLDTITADGTKDGDTLILRGADPTHIVTLRDAIGNIYLANSTNYDTNGAGNQISLRYLAVGAGLAPGWYEISRSAVFPTIANQRTQSIAVPVQGINSAAMPTSGNTTYAPNVDKGYQIVTGSPVLIGAVAYLTGGTPIAGDEFILDYRATPTVGAFSVTIFGIALTATQAAQGRIIAKTKYDGAAWQTTVVYKNNAIDLVDTVALATKEPGLGTPAANGYVLSSTTTDVRSWVPNSATPVIYNVTANNGTTAILTEENLKVYTMPGGTFASNGDILMLDAIYQTAANANAKTLTVYFGTTAIGEITGNFNNTTTIIEAQVNRIDANNQDAWIKIQVYTSAGAIAATAAFYTLPTENLVGDVDIKFSATNGVAAANDIISRQASVAISRKV